MPYPSRVQFFIDRGYQIHSHTPPNYSSCNLIHPETKIYVRTNESGSSLSYLIPGTMLTVSTGDFQNEHSHFERMFERRLKSVINRLDCREFGDYDHSNLVEAIERYPICPDGLHDYLLATYEMANFCMSCGERIRQ